MAEQINEVNLCKEYYKNIEKNVINANITKIRLKVLIKRNKNTDQTEKIKILNLLVNCLDDVIISIQEIQKLSTDYHNNKEISGIKTSYMPEDRSLDFTPIEEIFEYSNRFNNIDNNQLNNINQADLNNYNRLLCELLAQLGVRHAMLREDVTKLIEQRKRLFNLDIKELNNMLHTKNFNKKQEIEKTCADREENKLKMQQDAAKELKELELIHEKEIRFKEMENARALKELEMINTKDIHQLEENKLKMQNEAAKEMKELENAKDLKELEMNIAKDIRQIEFDEQLKMKQLEQAHEINQINAKLKLEELQLRKMEITSNDLRSKSPLKTI